MGVRRSAVLTSHAACSMLMHACQQNDEGLLHVLGTKAFIASRLLCAFVAACR
jgi:hypothetical protein